MKTTTKLIVTLALALLCAGSAINNANAGGVELKAGQDAPDLTVDTWLKGEKVEAYQPGTVYVVEFWGTWCGPCIKNIPHLTEIQKKYKDDGLVVLGIATHEWKGIDPVIEFMKHRGDDMGYTVGYDDDLSMEHDWQTAGEEGVIFKLPEVFLVDGAGKIAWTGHPDQKEDFHAEIEKALKNAKKS